MLKLLSFSKIFFSKAAATQRCLGEAFSTLGRTRWAGRAIKASDERLHQSFDKQQQDLSNVNLDMENLKPGDRCAGAVFRVVRQQTQADCYRKRVLLQSAEKMRMTSFKDIAIYRDSRNALSEAMLEYKKSMVEDASGRGPSPSGMRSQLKSKYKTAEVDSLGEPQSGQLLATVVKAFQEKKFTVSYPSTPRKLTKECLQKIILGDIMKRNEEESSVNEKLIDQTATKPHSGFEPQLRSPEEWHAISKELFPKPPKRQRKGRLVFAANTK